MSMNKQRHIDAFKADYKHLVADEFDAADITRSFYDEYMAVADLSADFYLETVRLVLQDHALPGSKLRIAGRLVNPVAIRRTAMLTVEGERDDICAIGQTMAALDLCPGIPRTMRQHHLQTGVGHYGVFNGRRWQQEIYPRAREMIQSMS